MFNMQRDSAKRQLQEAKDMLGISDERAKEIFQEQPDRKQQKKKELEEKGKLKQKEKKIAEEPEAVEEETTEEVELVACPDCGDEFESDHGMKIHKGQVH